MHRPVLLMFWPFISYFKGKQHKVKASSYNENQVCGLFIVLCSVHAAREYEREKGCSFLLNGEGKPCSSERGKEGTKEEYLSNLSHVFLRRDFFSHRMPRKHSGLVSPAVTMRHN